MATAPEIHKDNGDKDMNNKNTFTTDLQFQEIMKPAALKIYREIFPGCEVVYLTGADSEVHELDREMGIDARIELPTGQHIALQEKYRRHYSLRFRDFTQEYKNAVGTQYESKGEFFKLAAQAYFYGWANESATDFEAWILFDILKYKLLVEQAGGLDNMGRYMQNDKHGRASFYCIPITRIDRAIMESHGIKRVMRDLPTTTGGTRVQTALPGFDTWPEASHRKEAIAMLITKEEAKREPGTILRHDESETEAIVIW